MQRSFTCTFGFLLMVGIHTVAVAETESWETLNTAGILAYQGKNFITAKELFERALDPLEQGEHPDPRTAMTFNNLGAVHEKLGEFEQAELRYRNSLSVIEIIQGPNHPDIAMSLNNLASLYFSQKEFGKAEPLWQRSLEISETILGDNHPHLVQPLVTLGIVTQAQHKFDQAETFYLRAIQITEYSLTPHHPRLLPLYERYATLLHQAHREGEAVILQQKIKSIRSRNMATPSTP